MKTKLVFACILNVTLWAATVEAATVTHLRDDWRLQSACKIQATGPSIANPGFSTDGWLATTVPSTVLAAQVRSGQLPDPYYGDNLRQIPGGSYPIGQNFSNLPMPADSPYRCGWWYRKEFSVPPSSSADRRVWLHFGGINYRGQIWLNGKKLADATTVAGAYRIYDLDATSLIKPGAVNVLAVETTAPTEKDLGINWVDWNPCPPDKDMGLWGAVDLIESGPVTLRSPMVTTHFSNGDLKVAELTVYAELHNATDRQIKGTVSATLAGVHVEQPVELSPREDRTVVFTPQNFAELKLHEPQLWWPYQMGDPHLEQLTVNFRSDGKIIEEQSVRFGIREMTSELTATGGRLFRVNGKPILIRGGGWSQDMLLRSDDRRLRDQFRMVRDIGLNTIRLEGKLDTENFFQIADEQGILVMLGWCCCDHWEHWKDWTPEDLRIATASLQAQLLRLRGHPSLLAWLNGSDNPPPPEVERAYLQVEADTHWPNPILSSATGAATSVTGESGVKMTGPYDYVAPSYWYVDQHNGGAFGFNTETSPGPAIPSLASRQKFLPDAETWPPSSDWALHNGGGEFANLKVFDEAMASVYAPAHSSAEYERIAQTMEYDSERAMFEAYSRNKYVSTGVIQWMLNNAWPSMIWHLYDYYLDAGAGYFAAKKACEPLHIQYSYDDQSIAVVNSTYGEAANLHANVTVHNLDWKDLFHAERDITAAADSAQQAFSLPQSLFLGPDHLLLIDLSLSDQKGQVLSRNFYWVPTTTTTFDWPHTDYTHTPATRHEDLTALAHLPQATIQADAEIQKAREGSDLQVHLKNTSKVLAFQLHAAVRTPQGGLIAPVFWTDNWVELAPGESMTITANIPDAESKTPIVHIEGWNFPSAELTPSTAAIH